MSTIATIDIGTNTVLLLVAHFDGDGRISTRAYEQRVPRLGKGVDAGRNLQPEAMQRAVTVLHEYKGIMSQFALDAVVVAATSAVRDARNRGAFADLVERETGFRLEILSGDDEALWTYRGAVSGLPEVHHATVVDIGGGSTEITVGNRIAIHDKISLDIGSVRLTERCFRHDPPTHLECEKAIELVENELARPRGFQFKGSTLIGVAGTASSLAILDQGLTEFSMEAIINYRLRLDNVHALFRILRELPSAEILQRSSVMAGRNDIITAGALIVREIMAHYRFSEMIVSERGVRYGLAIREWEKQRLR